jgi:DNA mismatch repair protein MutL
MSQIKQLPPNVVNKIAAGEVVERPASIVKELVENAIDAGAGRIDVILREGGTEQVRVVDDGCGIPPAELALAVTSHATSKIRSDDDLFHIDTLGFRGEALASIASVARLRLRSRMSQRNDGAELEAHGGKRENVVPCGGATGTTIDVKDLFFNTPVRRKFLRTTRTELGHCSEAFTRLALAHPAIHFSLRHNDRLLHDLPPVETWRDRIAVFFGRPLADGLMEVASTEGNVEISGYVAHPQHSRSHARMQYLLLGGRFIRDRSLQHALGEAYRGLLLRGRYPICFLRIDLPADQVDVNVHPTKLEVRFRDARGLYRQLLATLRNRFLDADLTTSLEPKTAASLDDDRPLPLPLTSVRSEPGSDAVELPQRSTAWIAKAAENAPPAVAGGEQSPYRSATGQRDSIPAGTDQKPWDRAAPITAIQVMDRYLVAESDDAVIVMDQHALHESILYEKLRNKILSGNLDLQPLLVPEPVDLTATEASAVLDAQPLLAQLGIEVEPFGGETILITSVPAMLISHNRTDLLRTLAAQLTAGAKAPDRRDLLDELLHMVACKAAIKAGDRLEPEEIQDLLEQRSVVSGSHHCPHGRPTTLVFTREDLDRQFLRT